MSDSYPFGANTLIIPFTRTGGSTSPGAFRGMSRMRPTGELYRYGVVNSPRAGDRQQSPAAPGFAPAISDPLPEK